MIYSMPDIRFEGLEKNGLTKERFCGRPFKTVDITTPSV